VVPRIRRWDPDAVKANLDVMKRWGLNVVRGHQAVRYWIDNEGKTRDGTKIGTTYREAVKEVVKLCADRQMYYIREEQAPILMLVAVMFCVGSHVGL
jgi:hypothetical protein